MTPAESSLTTSLTTWRIDFRRMLLILSAWYSAFRNSLSWRSEKLQKGGSRSCERVFRKGEVIRWWERSFSRRAWAESRFPLSLNLIPFADMMLDAWALMIPVPPKSTLTISIVFSPCCAGPCDSGRAYGTVRERIHRVKPNQNKSALTIKWQTRPDAFGYVRGKCRRFWWCNPRIRVRQRLTEMLTSLPELLIYLIVITFDKMVKRDFFRIHLRRWSTCVVRANVFGLLSHWLLQVFWKCYKTCGRPSRMSTIGDHSS